MPTLSFYDAPDFQVEMGLEYQVRRILALRRLAIQARLQSKGEPSDAQWRPVHVLRVCGPMPILELAQICEIDSSGMTRVMDRLERKGLCQRSRDPSDRRKVNVSLTALGEEAGERVAPLIRQIDEGLLAGIDADERRKFFELLKRFAANAGAPALGSRQL